MRLIDRGEVEDILRDADILDEYQRTVLEEALEYVPDRAILRECDECFGASFGECEHCVKLEEVTE